MQNKITEFLVKDYNAKAIFLHGSRARGTPHKNSDWDLLVFTDKTDKENGGVKFGDQDLDIKIIKLPILDKNKFVSTYPQCLQFTKILLDTEDLILSEIKNITNLKYSKGPGIIKQRKDAIANHFDRMLIRLVDFKDDKVIFSYHLSTFYIKTVRFWFEYQGFWSQPIVEAIKIIEKKDKSFIDEIEIITDQNIGVDKKIVAAENMVKIVLDK